MICIITREPLYTRDLDLAGERLATALKHWPDELRTFGLQGMLHARRNQPELALQCLRKAHPACGPADAVIVGCQTATSRNPGAIRLRSLAPLVTTACPALCAQTTT